MLKNFFISLTRNAVSLAGAAIVTASAILFVTLFFLEVFGFRGSTYIGILAWVVLPAIFVAGLLLIPLGILRERRRQRRAAARGAAPPSFPVIDLNDGRTRNRALIFTALTAANIVILATATYKGVETMDSTHFCGQACHSVMQPEYTAYQRSPHASVRCAECHIGPGADWFLKAKLSGSRRLFAVAFNSYPRPIPTPVHSLRPASETCQQCHHQARFVGDRLKVIDGFSDDEPSSPAKTVLLMHVGGRQGASAQGIHWHADKGVQIRYLSDEKRKTIYEVELRTADGKVSRYSAGGAKPPAGAAWRVMDCVDCHNRPGHAFRPPEAEVDGAIVEGKIDRSLPFVHRESVRLLKGSYPSHGAAGLAMANGLQAFYRQQYPQVAVNKAAAIRGAAVALDTIYRSNVFPSMKIGWGTYPNHLGHESSPGCFRCHDDAHKTAEGKTISQDCSTCHSLLAMQEENPEILKSLSQ